MTPPIYGLTHIALKVHDLDQTIQFYEMVFGTKLYYRDETSAQLLGPGPHDVLAFELANQDIGAKGGVSHFGFRLTSPDALDELVSKAVASGATLIERGDFGDNQVFAFIRDPNGYDIELWFERTPAHVYA